MPNTYTQIYYHIVFSTKDRRPVLRGSEPRTELFRYLWGIHKNLNCHLYRLNGVEDHLHVLTAIHPTVALAEFVRTFKQSSSLWIKQQGIFPDFDGWQDGYGAFTLSFRERDMIIEYIKHQEEHHRRESYLDEFKRLLREAGIDYDERYLV